MLIIIIIIINITIIYLDFQVWSNLIFDPCKTTASPFIINSHIETSLQATMPHPFLIFAQISASISHLKYLISTISITAEKHQQPNKQSYFLASFPFYTLSVRHPLENLIVCLGYFIPAVEELKSCKLIHLFLLFRTS